MTSQLTARLKQSHSLWYTSSRNPATSQDHHHALDHAQLHAHQNQRRNTHLIDRSPLARLRADEQTLERRLHNVANFGTTWLKPPGIPKTLHQLREERREQEEHQEAMRREQLAQELAEAEAAGGGDAVINAAPGGEDPDAVMRDTAPSDAMDDVQLDGARDLDDDIPEADDDFLGGGDSDENEEDEEEDEDESETSSEDDEDTEQDPAGTPANAARTARMQQELMTQMMRRQPRRESVGEDEIDEEYQQHMIEEEDATGADADDMGMDVDLDDDIPEAESAGGYEHTDTEADYSDEGSSSSSDDGQGDVSFAAARAPAAVRFRGSLARSEGTRHSLAVSDLLSADGDSMLDSPHVQRRV